MSMQVLPTAPSPTVTHLMNLAVLIVLPPASFWPARALLLLVAVDACLVSVGLVVMGR